MPCNAVVDGPYRKPVCVLLGLKLLVGTVVLTFRNDGDPPAALFKGITRPVSQILHILSSRVGVPLNEINALRTFGRRLDWRLIACHRFLVLAYQRLSGFCCFHLLRIYTPTSFFTSRENACIQRFDCSVRRSASLINQFSSTSLVTWSDFWAMLARILFRAAAKIIFRNVTFAKFTYLLSSTFCLTSS